ncbi:MAG TPA: helix-turn-helix transcriptional regulator [Candidatus Scybalomonas excrementigallinarum]|nr:helix-turn-helix transcriptional regulator [Candidatus Scybalomonas excrementigallinarum]
MIQSKAIFSKNLTLFRIERGLDRTTAAKGIGITYQYLRYLEQGEKNPSFEIIDKICQFYQIEPYLLFWLDYDISGSSKDL